MKIYNGYERLPRNYTLMSDEYEFTMSNGYLINNRNEHEMADRAVKLLNNPDKLKELGENARTTALKYSKDEVKKMWIKLLG